MTEIETMAPVEPEHEVSKRHRILIAAAVAAVLGPTARVKAIHGWAGSNSQWLQQGRRNVQSHDLTLMPGQGVKVS